MSNRHPISKTLVAARARSAESGVNTFSLSFEQRTARMPSSIAFGHAMIVVIANSCICCLLSTYTCCSFARDKAPSSQYSATGTRKSGRHGPCVHRNKYIPGHSRRTTAEIDEVSWSCHFAAFRCGIKAHVNISDLLYREAD